MNESTRTIGLSQSAEWPHRIRAVAFDMDGLLVNTETLYSEVSDTILQRRGKRFTPDLKNKMMGLPAPEAFEVMIQYENLTDTAAKLQEETEHEFQQILSQRLQLMPGVIPLLEFLEQANLPKCIATSSTPEFAAQVLSLSKITERFHFVVTARNVEHGKPAPDIYLLAAQKLGVAAEEMLVLEDSQHGCAAGVASGACTIAVPSAHSEDQDFTGSHFVANTLKDPRILDTLAPR